MRHRSHTQHLVGSLSSEGHIWGLPRIRVAEKTVLRAAETPYYLSFRSVRGWPTMRNATEADVLDAVQMPGRHQVRVDRTRDSLLTDFGRATLTDRYLMPGEEFQDLF